MTSQLIGGFRDERSEAACGGPRTALSLVFPSPEGPIAASLTDAALELGAVQGMRSGAGGARRHDGAAMRAVGSERRDATARRTANLARVLVRHSSGIVHGPAGDANRSPAAVGPGTIAGPCTA